MTKQKRGRTARTLLLLTLIGSVAGVWAWRQGYLFPEDENFAIEGAPVRRGPLDITVTERGNLTAKNAVSIKSEIEGRTTLLYLIDEGVQVEPGVLLAELDTSPLEDQRVAQEIGLQSARAAATKAREGLEIQRIENESLIAKALQTVEFAKLELQKFLGVDLADIGEVEFEQVVAWLEEASLHEREPGAGAFTGGGREQQLQEARDEILIREEELKRAEDKLEWSRQLAEKGFVERTELEADELAYTRSGILLEQAQRALFLLDRYEHPKEWARLLGDLSEAERQLRKAEKQAVAQLADFEAAKEATKVKLELEEQKLSRLVDQISKGKIYAPVAGMVVYGRSDGSRYGGAEPVAEGGEVRERQEIVSIPGEGGMVAEASIHESALKQVTVGLSVTLRVDALRGREFHGVISGVAVLPDKNSWWANPNLRLYRTEVLVDDTNADMRPGMSCSIEIHVESLSDALFVPLQAVYSSGGKTLCWVRKGIETERRAVTIGLNNEKWIQIVEGLAEGELVLLSPPLDFAPEETPGESSRPAPEGDSGGEEPEAKAATGADSGETKKGLGGRTRSGAGGRPAVEGQAVGSDPKAEGSKPASEASGK